MTKSKKSDPVFKDHEKILEAVHNSGYLFEIEVAKKIEALGFDIQMNVAFNDKDSDKSREIDIVAHKNLASIPANKIKLALHLVIEAKKFKSPILFFKRKKSETDKSHSPIELHFPMQHFQITDWTKSTSKISTVSFYKDLKLEEHHLYESNNFNVTQFCRLIRNEKKIDAKHENIYDSLLFPSAKALLYMKDILPIPRNIAHQQYYHVIFNVIVTDSDVLSINSEVPEYPIETEKFITLKREIRTDKTQGIFYFDFVNFNHLDDYIEGVNNYINPIINRFSSNPEEFQFRKREIVNKS